MKKYFAGMLSFMIACFLLQIEVNAQNFDNQEIKTVVENILTLSKSKSYNKLAPFIAYKGRDNTREIDGSFSAKNADELNEVQRIGKKIGALLNLSDTYKIAKAEAQKVQGKDGYLVTVDFISGSQSLSTEFRFIKHSNGYVLYDMN